MSVRVWRGDDSHTQPAEVHTAFGTLHLVTPVYLLHTHTHTHTSPWQPQQQHLVHFILLHPSIFYTHTHTSPWQPQQQQQRSHSHRSNGHFTRSLDAVHVQLPYPRDISQSVRVTSGHCQPRCRVSVAECWTCGGTLLQFTAEPQCKWDCKSVVICSSCEQPYSSWFIAPPCTLMMTTEWRWCLPRCVPHTEDISWRCCSASLQRTSLRRVAGCSCVRTAAPSASDERRLLINILLVIVSPQLNTENTVSQWDWR